jgi:peptidoglycan/xylan/chitin deacetylase (PgdA/CDA1 family)
MLADPLKRVLYASGFLGAFHRVRNRKTLTVAMYHRVLNPADPRWASCDPDFTLSDELFERTVRFLKCHYNVVALEDLAAARRGTTRLPARALLLTFDDGWSDNLDYALPILRKERVPAVMFVVADAVGASRPFFQEELVAAFRSGRLPPEVLARLWEGAGLPASAPLGAVLTTQRRLIAALESLPTADRERLLAPHAATLSDGLRHMVSANELRQLPEGAVAIGLHGKTHTPLTRADDLDAEIRGARQAVARHLGRVETALVALSFPHGRWTPGLVERARAHGYELLFTSDPVLNGLGLGCPDVLGRVEIATEGTLDSRGRFRPDWLALQLFRRPVLRLNSRVPGETPREPGAASLPG